MQLLICRICGDLILGDDKPYNCPFCGAKSKYIVPISQYQDYELKELIGISRKNLEESLKLEIDNTQFYTCISKSSSNFEIQKLFKALAKVEWEHASMVCKMLGIKKPPLEEKDTCFNSDKKNLQDFQRREKLAVERYSKFANEAIEQKVKVNFHALVEIESDHLAISKEELKKFE